LILLADENCAKGFFGAEGIGSELAFEIYLETATGIGRSGEAEIGIAGSAIGTDDADIRDIVRMIEDVEDVERG
jgi:hypothetical protein